MNKGWIEKQGNQVSISFLSPSSCKCLITAIVPAEDVCENNTSQSPPESGLSAEVRKE